MTERSLQPVLAAKLAESKIVVLSGPRKSGRKTLLNNVLASRREATIAIDCSNKQQKKAIDSVELFREYTAGKAIVILEEAQYLTQLQAIIDDTLGNDSLENLVLCCSFEPALQEELWEALRYQGLEIIVYPYSYPEMAQVNGVRQEDELVDRRLIFGYYPEVVADPENAEQTLIRLLEEGIFTQLGAADRINKSDRLIQLLRLLAFNIGQAISYNDLGQQCGLDNETVERYIHLLEKAHLLFILPSYYNGHRYELKKSHTVYFTDNGIRNALIRQFQPLEFRNDIDLLWKNWVISERRKANALAGRMPYCYFWKTHTKQEMDYMEISETGIAAYKMQWDRRKKIRIPASFTQAYPEIKATGINRTTFWSLLTKK
jgi:predicted AAA+ superfamily ATPase